MNLRLTPQESQQLSELAAFEGKSKQQVITSLIKQEWEQVQARATTSNALDEIFSRRSALMERLKDA
ncbi:hypothetical protein N24_0712 [Corynebacterium suranareeae]|uniref:Uncharacterized protein n=1 Tax=Corynebacterium suranareeae TaxID=2506452 RepID=A0A160PNL4_9CORY|nr:hypothetical protein [Corynebacterium suranareeae]BAU94974.1 hypothetical protein N24_0712 [Corynebacterium suranareeae]